MVSCVCVCVVSASLAAAALGFAVDYFGVPFETLVLLTSNYCECLKPTFDAKHLKKMDFLKLQ